MELNNENIATWGLRTWEQTGTIALDFANYLDELSGLKGIDLGDFLDAGWYQVGFRFGKSLVANTDTLNLDIVLCKKESDDNIEYGYLTRKINKKDFLILIVNFTAYVSNQNHFESDDIPFRKLTNLEEKDN